MTIKEFAQHMGASNGRKAFVLAIEKHVERGVDIIGEEAAATKHYNGCRAGGADRDVIDKAKSRLQAARQAKRAAEETIIKMFDLPLTPKARV